MRPRRSTWWLLGDCRGDHRILVIGIKESANFNSAIVIIKLSDRRDLSGGWRLFPVSPSCAREAELASIHSAEGCERELRLGRHSERALRDLLRLYRIRRGVDRRAGSQESEARYAHRHPWIARGLHHPLHPGLARAHRSGELQDA